MFLREPQLPKNNRKKTTARWVTSRPCTSTTCFIPNPTSTVEQHHRVLCVFSCTFTHTPHHTGWHVGGVQASQQCKNTAHRMLSTGGYADVGVGLSCRGKKKQKREKRKKGQKTAEPNTTRPSSFDPVNWPGSLGKLVPPGTTVVSRITL